MGLGVGLGIAISVAEGVGEPVSVALGVVLSELSAAVRDVQPLTIATIATPIRRLLGGSTPSP